MTHSTPKTHLDSSQPARSGGPQTVHSRGQTAETQLNDILSPQIKKIKSMEIPGRLLIETFPGKRVRLVGNRVQVPGNQARLLGRKILQMNRNLGSIDLHPAPLQALKMKEDGVQENLMGVCGAAQKVRAAHPIHLTSHHPGAKRAHKVKIYLLLISTHISRNSKL